MAVLKSPRNSRQKKKWAATYVLSNSRPDYRLTEKKQARIHHKLQLFLQDKICWTAKKDAANKSLPEGPAVPKEKENKPRPYQYLVYSTRRFDVTLTSPLFLRQHLRSSRNKKRFFHILNSNKI